MLQQHIDNGTIYIDGNEYVGVSDVLVHIGYVGDESRIELYLVDHPTPDTW